MSKKYFGTDGIRGEVGQYPITPDFFLRLGMAAGSVFANHGANRVIIGKDTRISGYMFESALEAGFSATGMDVLLLGPMPTPAIAYLTRTFNASAGVVISASHNPYYDNGVKFFSRKGMKLPDAVEYQIENLIDKDIPVVDPLKLGKVRRINDASGRYIEHCKGTVRPRLDLTGLNIIVDTAHGANYIVGPEVFRELGANVTVIGGQPDGININKNCGSTNLQALQQKVTACNADLGIAFDGDGDRLMMVDNKGDIVDGDEILFIIACYRAKERALNGGVVGTVMTNLGMENALLTKGIPFYRANVGDRYVNESLLKKNWMLGGESSGHIICRHISTTGDGIAAALQVLAAIQGTEKTLNELKKGMDKYPQLTINVPVTKRLNIFANEEINKAVSQTEKNMGLRGRVLLRPSGTEPVIRVMVEGEDLQEVKLQVNELAIVVKNLVS